MNKNTLLLITSDKMILKINYLKIHSCKVTLSREQTRICDLWFVNYPQTKDLWALDVE